MDIELSASLPDRFIPRGKEYARHCVGGWVGSEAWPCVSENRKNFLSLPAIEIWFCSFPAHRLVYTPTQLSLSMQLPLFTLRTRAVKGLSET
jgi:hypothetical protein